MSSFGNFFLGKPEKTQQFSTLNQGQGDLLSQLLSMLSGSLPQAFQNQNDILSGNPEAFKSFEAPAMRQFNEEILPSLAEGFGGLGAGSSSGAQQTFARAGERLSENLQAQRSGLQQNAMQNLMGFLGQGLQPTQQTAIRPATSGFLGGLAPGIGQGGMLGLLAKLGIF